MYAIEGWFDLIKWTRELNGWNEYSVHDNGGAPWKSVGNRILHDRVCEDINLDSVKESARLRFERSIEKWLPYKLLNAGHGCIRQRRKSRVFWKGRVNCGRKAWEMGHAKLTADYVLKILDVVVGIVYKHMCSVQTHVRTCVIKYFNKKTNTRNHVSTDKACMMRKL